MHYYLPTTLEFLQSLLDRGQAPSTLKVYVATISSQHVRVNNSTLGCHGQVTLFLKGALSLCPPQTLRVPAWDLPLVLEAICSPHFEPLEGAQLKWSSIMMAIISTKRDGELHSL